MAFIVPFAIAAAAGAAAGAAAASGGDNKPKAPPPPPPPTDYSAAMMVLSDNNKTTALVQVQSQMFALQQAAIDRQMQNAANIELGLEKLDTNLQTSRLDYIQHMTAEENRHQEKLAKIGLKGGHVHKTSGSDIPEPHIESESTHFTGIEPEADTASRSWEAIRDAI